MESIRSELSGLQATVGIERSFDPEVWDVDSVACFDG
jgi:hypothetical protein